MSNPTCPECEHVFNEDETWYGDVYSDEGSISETKCSKCSHVFNVICHHDVNWKVCDEYGDEII